MLSFDIVKPPAQLNTTLTGFTGKQVGLSRATLESQVKAFHFDPAELPSKIIQWVNNSTCLELTSPDLT